MRSTMGRFRQTEGRRGRRGGRCDEDVSDCLLYNSVSPGGGARGRGESAVESHFTSRLTDSGCPSMPGSPITHEYTPKSVSTVHTHTHQNVFLPCTRTHTHTKTCFYSAHTHTQIHTKCVPTVHTHTHKMCFYRAHTHTQIHTKCVSTVHTHTHKYTQNMFLPHTRTHIHKFSKQPRNILTTQIHKKLKNS